jgi:hypothetical protein
MQQEYMHNLDCPAISPLPPQSKDDPACTCNESERMRRGDTSPRRDAHYPECPRAQRLDTQREAQGHQPEDEPDTLTKLERHVRSQAVGPWAVQALDLIAQAREEQKMLEGDNAAFDVTLHRVWNEAANIPPEWGARIVALCDSLRTQPHPGAALLAEHAKTRQSIADILGAARGYSDKPHQLYSAVRRAAILHTQLGQLDQTVAEMDLAYDHHDRYRADHAKALVRARNEGLNEAHDVVSALPPEARTMSNILGSILLLKEPEE